MIIGVKLLLCYVRSRLVRALFRKIKRMKLVERVAVYLPLGHRRWPNAIRWLSLFMGFLGMALSGTNTTFSFWQNAMRGILNQTETQSNLVVTLGYVGSLIAFPAGLLYESYGCQVTVITGAIMSCLSLLLLSIATSSWKVFFAANPWLVDIIYFFLGFGCIFTYMGSFLPNVENFPLEQRGKVRSKNFNS